MSLHSHQTAKVGSPPPRVSPERLAEIPVNNGQDKATLVREVSPKGEIVVHAVKKSAYVHERLHDLGRIDDEMYDAAERFRKDFERAHLDGRFATIDLFRSSGGCGGDISDGVAEARTRINAALNELGRRSSGKSLGQSCVWFVVGCGHTLEQWALRMRGNGSSIEAGREAEQISEGKASGILYSCLEKLAFHYGIVNTKTIKDRASNLAYARGRKDEQIATVAFMELAAVNTKITVAELIVLIKGRLAKIKNAG